MSGWPGSFRFVVYVWPELWLILICRYKNSLSSSTILLFSWYSLSKLKNFGGCCAVLNSLFEPCSFWTPWKSISSFTICFLFWCFVRLNLKLTNAFRENILDLLQRFRRDRHVLLNFILSGSLIKKVVMPPGAVSLDDVDIDQVSIDYVLNCAKKGSGS